ncbi:hypothetical protein AHiyo6_00430 [Arthrobacter sp. Hiyo6]|nr:hypothetical protein AHiyo6_00430 [Arthrobacter sp. Hiyo6]
MDFNPSTWGTVGQWASAVITGSAFFATFYVIRRDAKVRLFAQARQVAYYIQKKKRSLYEIDEGEDPIHDFTVINLSAEPIYDVMQVSDSNGSVGLLEFRAVLLPNDQHVFQGADYSRTALPILSFRDNSGAVWARSISGKLHRTGTRKDWFGRRPPRDFNPDVIL